MEGEIMPAANPRLSVIVVSYNTRDLTLECLESLFADIDQDACEVIVIDNASQDGSAPAIAAAFPGATVIPHPENAGFAGANNIAVAQSKGSLILLLNPDTVIKPGAIERLLQCVEAHPGAGIFGGRTVFLDGSLNPSSCWRRPTIWGSWCRALGVSAFRKESPIFASDTYGGWQRDSSRFVDILSGCYLLVRREVWEELGGFDTRFFMYGEDWDLCLRARAHGHRCYFCHESEIVHYGGASEPQMADKIVRLLATRAELYRRHAASGLVRFALLLSLQVLVLRSSITSQWKARRKQGNGDPSPANTWLEVWRRRKEWLHAPQTS